MFFLRRGYHLYCCDRNKQLLSSPQMASYTTDDDQTIQSQKNFSWEFCRAEIVLCEKQKCRNHIMWK